MVRTQIQLTEEQAAKLKKMAADRHVSLAELIRQGVEIVLRSGAVSEEEKRERAVAAAGRFRSGEHDVSSRHDEYLAEAYRK
jgi:hypothetical protein